MTTPNFNTDSVPGPGPKVADSLWKILIYGLLLIIVGALIGAFMLTSDVEESTDPGPFFAVATAALTGLLGLFVNPRSGGNA